MTIGQGPGSGGPVDPIISAALDSLKQVDVPDVDAIPTTPPRSPTRRALRRFVRNKLAVLGVLILFVVIVASVFAPFFAGLDPSAIDLSSVLNAPSRDHLLGTDQAGRDVLARVLYGGRVSLTIGFAAAASTVLLGLVLGLVAGYRGGVADWIIMRLVEVVLSFPTLVLIIFFITRFGRTVGTIVLVMALFQWPLACRLVRNMTVSIKELEFVHAARAFGARGIHTTMRHVLPAAVGPLTVAGTLLAAQAILVESALAFLGFGIAPPTPSWGGILNEAQSLTVLETMPWLWIPPGLLITLTVLSINFVGDGLRDALDPRVNESR
jgi:peptide/nickel transport system permease protein